MASAGHGRMGLLYSSAHFHVSVCFHGRELDLHTGSWELMRGLGRDDDVLSVYRATLGWSPCPLQMV